MKKHLITMFFLSMSIVLCADELSWVDTQIDAIKPPRKGMSISSLNKIGNPFIFLQKEEKVAEKDKKNKTKINSSRFSNTKKSSKPVLRSKKELVKRLKLSAIINKSVLINNKWYYLNDKIYDYTISKINTTTIVLSMGKKKLVLSTEKSTRNIKFK